MVVDLSVEIAGVRFKNPVWVASSELSGSLNNTHRAILSGAGGVVLKSLADNPKYNDSRITKWRFLNEKNQLCRRTVPRNFTMYSRGGPAQRTEEFLKNIEQKKTWAKENNVVLIGSIAEADASAWVRAARVITDAGLQLIELNFGSPHSEVSDKRTGMELGQDINKVREIVTAVTQAVTVPVIGKLTQQVADVAEIARAAKEAGAAAVTIGNRNSGFLVDLETGKPYLSGWAGVGGPWMKPLTMGWVSRTFANAGLPVVASGGASDWRDAAEFLLAGASAVQYCSAVMVRGYRIIGETLTGLSAYLEKKGYASVSEIIGHATKKAISYKEVLSLPVQKATMANPDTCSSCYICVERCLFGAIDKADHGVVISDRCVGCGLCVSICPSESIELGEKGGA